MFHMLDGPFCIETQMGKNALSNENTIFMHDIITCQVSYTVSIIFITIVRFFFLQNVSAPLKFIYSISLFE
jgi:hypothetical protein